MYSEEEWQELRMAVADCCQWRHKMFNHVRKMMSCRKRKSVCSECEDYNTCSVHEDKKFAADEFDKAHERLCGQISEGDCYMMLAEALDLYKQKNFIKIFEDDGEREND